MEPMGTSRFTHHKSEAKISTPKAQRLRTLCHAEILGLKAFDSAAHAIWAHSRIAGRNIKDPTTSPIQSL